MNPLRRTPLFVALLVVLAAGGGTAGAVLGARTPPDAVRANTGDCTTGADVPMAPLLPASSFVSHSSTEREHHAPGTAASFSYTCRMSTPAAAVTVLTRTAPRGTPAQWERQFAGTRHLRVQDATHVPANGGTLIWPTAAFAHFICAGGRTGSYEVEVRLTGDAGRATSSRERALTDIVTATVVKQQPERCS